MPLKPEQTREALLVLARTDHRYLGIAPADEATVPTALAVILANRTVNALADASDTATRYWPRCESWSILGADQVLEQRQDDWPPNVRAMRHAEALASF